MANKSTINDVARVAGVSIATVSRVLNSKDIVRKSTRDKVYSAIRKVDYDFAGKGSFRQPALSDLLLVLLPDIGNPFYTTILSGIRAAFTRHGYQDIIKCVDERELTAPMLEDISRDTNVSGMISLCPVSDPCVLNTINYKIPIIQCCEFNERSDISYVSIDDFLASRGVVEYMLSKGKKKIALINGPIKYKYARQRREGYFAALTEAGIKIDENIVVQLPAFSFDAALSVITQLISSESRPDAVFAASDVFAIAAIKAAIRAGLNVPRDLGICGFDNTYISTMCEPSLTTVSQPQFQLGYTAGEMLIERIINPAIPPKQLLLKTELIIRDSL